MELADVGWLASSRSREERLRFFVEQPAIGRLHLADDNPACKVKIIFLIGSLDIGGSEKQMVELAARLDRKMFDPIICTFFAAGPLEAVALQHQIPVVNLREGFSTDWFVCFKAIRFLRTGLRLVRFLQRTRPQILHAFLFWTYVAGALAARMAGVPVFISSRRGLGLFKDDKVYLQWLDNLANHLSHAILVNCQAIQDDVLKRDRVDSRRIRLVFNGVDVGRYHYYNDAVKKKTELGLDSQARVIGVIANLIPYKGHHDMIRAFAELARRHSHIFLLLVGKDNGIQPDLEKLCKQLGVSERVIFTGSRQDIPEILSVINVQVIPSHQEGFSNAILEGMAAGKPLVVTKVGGNAEAVIHNETGLVIPSKDPHALSQAVEHFLIHPALAEQMGNAAYRRVNALFGIDRMVYEYESLYLELVNHSKNHLKGNR